MNSLKNIILIVAILLVLIVGLRIEKEVSAKKEACEKREALIVETNECIESGEWICAERNVRLLLQENPDDKNLQLHLAGILFEQERYEDCVNYIAGLGYSNKDFDYLTEKSRLLLHEMATLELERSAHFRLEFDGRPARNDVLEALSVLEVAYDSLCRLFEFYPENKMSLVLHEAADYQGVGPRPEWVGAVFDGKLRVPVNMMQYPEVYRPMLFHELTHAFVRAMTRSKIPLWINEGIAQVVDGSRAGKDRPEGGAPSLNALTEPFVNEKSTDNAVRLYWYSDRMVRGLLNRNNDFVHFRKFVQSIRNLGAEQALKEFYSVTAEQLLDEVR
ncbi:MAG: hypothetical protein MJZ05_13565 [Fibrobacter sp.]|nr:hypothetical protein [Fibrobacter sp.]